MPDAFISYSRRDGKDLAKRIHRALEQAGKESWVDLEDIPPASRWEEDLREGVAHADSLVFVISEGSLESEHCLSELDYAVTWSKRVIPISTGVPPGKSMPQVLRERNWIPADGTFDDDFDAGVARLIEAMETDLDWVRGHTHWGARADEWERRSRDGSLLLRGSELEEAELWLSGQADKQPPASELHREYILTSRRRSSRRQRLALGAALAVLVLVGVAAVVAVLQRNEARDQRREADARALAAGANESLTIDPELSVLLSLEAAKQAATQEVADALRRSLDESRIRVRFDAHDGRRVIDGDLTSDGGMALTAGGEGRVFLWDALTGEEQASLEGHSGAVNGADFSPNGKFIATAGRDGVARVWNAETGVELDVLGDHGKALFDVAFSDDSRLIATAGQSGTVTVWNRRTGEPVSRRRASRTEVNAIAFGPGDVMGTVDASGGARIWRDGDQVELPGHKNGATDIAFSPTGKLVATAGDDATARIWDARTGAPLTELEGHSGGVFSVTFSPAGDSIATGGEDGTVRVWDPATGEEQEVLRGHGSSVFSVSVGPAGELLSTGLDGTARVWDVAGDEGSSLPGHRGPVSDVSFSRDGETIATSGLDGRVLLHDAETGTAGTRLGPRAGGVQGVSFDPAGDMVAGAGSGGAVRRWQLPEGSPAPAAREHRGLVYSVEFSPDGDLLASGAADGRVLISPAEGGEPLQELDEPAGYVLTVTFSPDGDLVGAIGLDGVARLWETDSGELVRELDTGGVIGVGLAFGPDGDLVAATSADGTARVWKVETGDLLATLRGHAGFVNGVAFSPDGRLVATAGEDGTVRLWEPDSGAQTAVLEFGGDFVNAVAFSPDGAEIASAGLGDANAIRTCPCTTAIDELVDLAESRVTRGLTDEERARFLRD